MSLPKYLNTLFWKISKIELQCVSTDLNCAFFAVTKTQLHDAHEISYNFKFPNNAI
jgi:hypothetical protein